MAKRSDTSPAPLGDGSQPPRSDAADNNPPPAPADGSPAANASQKRGRGRPPKSKSDSQPNGAVSAQPARKQSGRPKRNVAAAVPTASAAAAAVVKSGRGRPKRSSTLPATESVTGSRKRGRPKKDDVAAAAPATKRGRKPKTEQVAKQRTSNRTRKATTEATTGHGAAEPRELKKKVALLQKKVKQAAVKLQIAVSAVDEVQKIADGM